MTYLIGWCFFILLNWLLNIQNDEGDEGLVLRLTVGSGLYWVCILIYHSVAYW